MGEMLGDLTRSKEVPNRAGAARPASALRADLSAPAPVRAARGRAIVAGAALGALGLWAAVALFPKGLDASTPSSASVAEAAVSPLGRAADDRLGAKLRAHFAGAADPAPANPYSAEPAAAHGPVEPAPIPAEAPAPTLVAPAPLTETAVAVPVPAPEPPPAPVEVVESAAPAPQAREADPRPVLVASATIDGEGAITALPRAESTPLPVSEARTARESAPAAAPVAALAPPKPRLSADDVRELMARAGDLLRRADIAGARLLLSHAAGGDEPRATYVLAQTYDPNVLSGLKVRGIKADADKARQLYGQALAGGVAEAEGRIGALPGKPGR